MQTVKEVNGKRVQEEPVATWFPENCSELNQQDRIYVWALQNSKTVEQHSVGYESSYHFVSGPYARERKHSRW